MKKTYNEFGDFAPKSSSNQISDTLLIAALSAMIAICFGVYLVFSLLEIARYF